MEQFGVGRDGVESGGVAWTCIEESGLALPPSQRELLGRQGPCTSLLCLERQRHASPLETLPHRKDADAHRGTWTAVARELDTHSLEFTLHAYMWLS